MAAHEAEAFVDDVEDAAGEFEAGPFRLALQDPVGDVVATLLGAGLELEVAGDLAELGDAHLAQVGDVEVVAVAGGLDLLLLVVLRHGSPDRALGAAGTGTATLTIALIGTELGHEKGLTASRKSTTPPGARAESCRCDARREGMHGA